MAEVKITQLPYLNTVVIKQSPGSRFFVAATDSFIIDKAGLIKLIEELVRMGFIHPEDISSIVARIGIGNEN